MPDFKKGKQYDLYKLYTWNKAVKVAKTVDKNFNQGYFKENKICNIDKKDWMTICRQDHFVETDKEINPFKHLSVCIRVEWSDIPQVFYIPVYFFVKVEF